MTAMMTAERIRQVLDELGKDEQASLDDETVIETSYKFQLSQNFSLTPDFQVIFNPDLFIIKFLTNASLNRQILVTIFAVYIDIVEPTTPKQMSQRNWAKVRTVFIIYIPERLFT